MIAALVGRLAAALTRWTRRPAVQLPPPRTFDEGVDALITELDRRSGPDQPADRDR